MATGSAPLPVEAQCIRSSDARSTDVLLQRCRCHQLDSGNRSSFIARRHVLYTATLTGRARHSTWVTSRGQRVTTGAQARWTHLTATLQCSCVDGSDKRSIWPRLPPLTHLWPMRHASPWAVSLESAIYYEWGGLPSPGRLLPV